MNCIICGQFPAIEGADKCGNCGIFSLLENIYKDEQISSLSSVFSEDKVCYKIPQFVLDKLLSLKSNYLRWMITREWSD